MPLGRILTKEAVVIPRKLLLAAAALGLAVAEGLAFALWRRNAELPPVHHAMDSQANPAQDAPAAVALNGDGLDATLASLLRQSAKDDGERTSSFFKTLAGLARKHGLTLNDYDPTRDADEGYALRRGNYVVVVLRGDSHFIPGDDTQMLLLFNQRGDLLDSLSCAVNNRLTRHFVNHQGGFFTDAPQPPEPDGAQLVIRYQPDGDELSGNWSHSILHEGMNRSFAWGPGADWAKKGLCRVAFGEGKFAILFPKPKAPAARP